MAKSYTIPAVAIALCVSEAAITEKIGAGIKAISLAQVLALSEDAKLKKYTEEAAKIKEIVDAISVIEAETNK